MSIGLFVLALQTEFQASSRDMLCVCLQLISEKKWTYRRRQIVGLQKPHEFIGISIIMLKHLWIYMVLSMMIEIPMDSYGFEERDSVFLPYKNIAKLQRGKGLQTATISLCLRSVGATTPNAFVTNLIWFWPQPETSLTSPQPGTAFDPSKNFQKAF